MNPIRLWAFRIVCVAFIIAVLALVFYFPLIFAIIFVGLLIFLTVIKTRAEGFWKGLKFFLKEILFGW